MARENPAALVELALKSAGPSLHLDDFERLLIPRVISKGEYKKWWEAAKRQLKSARHIVVPTKRADPLILRNQDEKQGGIMVRDFLAARDLKKKLASLAAISKDLDLFENAAQELIPVFRDISDAVSKSFRLQLKESLQLLLCRDELAETAKAELPLGSLKAGDVLREMKSQAAEAINQLPAGLLGRVYRSFPEAFPNRVWVTESLNHLTRTGGRAVAEIASVLDANDEIDVLADFLKKAVRNRNLSTDLLIWITKERKGLAAPVFDIDLGNAILGALEDDHMAGGPKRTGRLAEALNNDRELLGELVAEADDDDLRLFAKRLMASNVFDELTRRSLMARVIKARPEMEALMAEGAETQKDEALIVSWESLEKKKQELDDIINVKIPQNKKDISIAREYGDLRENFEYKSAKQQQAVLLRMQSKIERELRHARGTDFNGVDASKAGIGTVVDIEDTASGEKETYTILGAWDGDVENNIISYLSESAKALIGHAAGEEVDLPSETKGVSRKARVLAVRAFKS
jgi:transcription elongation GreA/GreB family factor